MMKKNSKILILGASGLLGSAILKLLKENEYSTIFTPNSKELNLLDKGKVENYLKKQKPEFIFMVAGLVGGILENKNFQADFLYQNMTMVLNLIEGVKNTKIKTKILYTGSTCIYPNDKTTAIREDEFLSSKLEETNIGYAIAKITGIVACKKYKEQYGINSICVMPTNLYGIGDNYNLQSGHFFAALIKKFLLAKENNLNEIIFWGSGKAKRESLYNLDCADVIIYLMKEYNSTDIVNIGTGYDYSITEYVKKMIKITNFEGKIIWDKTKPDGMKRKLIDISRLKKIYPKFNPRSFEKGVKEILNDKEEVYRILR